MKKYNVIFATGNAGKLREVRELLEPYGCTVTGIRELGLKASAEETGSTFSENAAIKAREIFEKLTAAGTATAGTASAGAASADTASVDPGRRGIFLSAGIGAFYVMSDDSGLCIDAFDGGPGVESARFLGHETSYDYKNARILEMMADVPEEKRGAHYACNICVIDSQGREYHEEACVYGRISREPSGTGGFGYDPVFYLPDYGTTMACISEEEKNSISHRGTAIRRMAERLFG